MKKVIALILLGVMLIAALSACSGDGEQSVDPSASVSQEASVEESSVDPKSIFVTPQKDMGGREFLVLCWDFGYGSNSILGYTGEVLYNEENPDSVDEAKKQVIDIVEDRFKCKISGQKVFDRNNTVQMIVRNQYTANLPEYDIIFDSIASTTPLVAEQCLADLTTIPTIDLSAPWWDQNSVQDLSIANKLYFVAGDINTYDNQGTWCILFNKNLKTALNIEEDFYQLVRDNQWTFDKLVEICSRPGITQDNKEPSGTLDEKDQWAFGTESYNMYVHLVAGGQKIAQKDDDDLPYLTVAKDPAATYKMLQDVLDFYNRHDIVMCANFSNYTNKGFPNVWEATVHKAFVEGRELFYMCGLINVASFRVMTDEFGILPVPKYDKNGEWHHTVSVQNSTVMSIPANAVDIDDVGTIVSALSEESRKYVTPAYYDIQLKYRDAKDDESGEMLDLIFSTRTFDLGAAFGWGGILSLYMEESASNVVSRFESGIGAAQAALDKTLEDINAMR